VNNAFEPTQTALQARGFVQLRQLRVISTALLTLLSFWPYRVFAEERCEPLNPGACLDQGMYTFYLGIAAMIWSFDRTLLVLAYQLDHLRWWLANQAFQVAYAAIRNVATPLITPTAVLAVMIGLLLFLLVPMLGRINLINIRQVFIWLLIAPVLLSEAGLWMLELEHLRNAVSSQITTQIGVATAQGLFGGSSSDPSERVNTPVALYPAAGEASPCDSTNITRAVVIDPTTASPGIRMDDLAAALLLANAQDIHCPSEQAPIAILPDGFDGVFIVSGGIEYFDATQRATAIANIQQGITRLLLGIVACLLAVGEVLIQLAFTLGLITVWLCLPIVAVLILFADTLRPLGILIQRIISITLTAWVVTAILALINVCLMGAAASGSATALIALSFGGLFLLARLLVVAFTTLSETFSSITGLAGASTKIALAGATIAAGSLLQRGSRLASRTVREAVGTTGQAAISIATHVSGSGRSVAETVIRPIAQVGMVAASMGPEPAVAEHATQDTTAMPIPSPDGRIPLRARSPRRRRRSTQ
jgi:hypothetical protein